VPAREDPRDVLVSRSGQPLLRLAKGSRVGTSSLRRALAIQDARPDLEVVPIRGNVDTRLRKTEDGTVDAVILALAGLKRLGLEARATELLDPSISLPAIGQGALGIECREDDAATIEALAVMRDAETSIAVAAERAVMAAVDGSCRMPVAAHAVHVGESMLLRGLLAEADGSRPRRAERQTPWPKDEAEAARVGEDLGAELKRG
jgi:hydroxymethylbilane synthase